MLNDVFGKKLGVQAKALTEDALCRLPCRSDTLISASTLPPYSRTPPAHPTCARYCPTHTPPLSVALEEALADLVPYDDQSSDGTNLDTAHDANTASGLGSRSLVVRVLGRRVRWVRVLQVRVLRVRRWVTTLPHVHRRRHGGRRLSRRLTHYLPHSLPRRLRLHVRCWLRLMSSWMRRRTRLARVWNVCGRLCGMGGRVCLMRLRLRLRPVHGGGGRLCRPPARRHRPSMPVPGCTCPTNSCRHACHHSRTAPSCRQLAHGQGAGRHEPRRIQPRHPAAPSCRAQPRAPGQHMNNERCCACCCASRSRQPTHKHCHKQRHAAPAVGAELTLRRTVRWRTVCCLSSSSRGRSRQLAGRRLVCELLQLLRLLLRLLLRRPRSAAVGDEEALQTLAAHRVHIHGRLPTPHMPS